MQEEESDDDAVVVAHASADKASTSKGGKRADRAQQGDSSAQPSIRGSRFFSAFDVSAEEKKQRKKKASMKETASQVNGKAKAKQATADDEAKPSLADHDAAEHDEDGRTSAKRDKPKKARKQAENCNGKDDSSKKRK